MKNPLIIKTYGKNLLEGVIKEVILNEDNISSIEKENDLVIVRMSNQDWWVDLSNDYEKWENDVFKRKSYG